MKSREIWVFHPLQRLGGSYEPPSCPAGEGWDENASGSAPLPYLKSLEITMPILSDAFNLDHTWTIQK